MEVNPGQQYQHYKGGMYVVLHVVPDATNEREGNQVVVYQSKEDGKMWCRDLAEFIEVMTLPDGTTTTRFVLVS